VSYEFKGLRGLGALGELQFKDRFDVRGSRDFSPDKGNTSFHFRNCTLKVDAPGAWGATWDCQRVDHKQVTVRAGQTPPLPIGEDPERNCKLKSTTPAGTKYYDCPRWVVDAPISETDLASFRPRCLLEGRQGEPEWRLKAEKRPDAGSSADRYFQYLDVFRQDKVLRCKFTEPLPSKEAAFKAAAYKTAVAAGQRMLTEAEKEQFSSLCEPYVTVTGDEIPRKLAWRKETDYIGSTIVKTDIVDGGFVLTCVPDLSAVKIKIDNQLTQLNQERAWAAASQRSPEDQRRLQEQQDELQRILAEGEETPTPFYVRYKVPLMMVGAMLVIGGAAAVIQRVMKGKTLLKKNPGPFVVPEGEGLWMVYWHQPGTAKQDAPVIGWVRFADDDGAGDIVLLTESIDGATQLHHSFDEATKWLVRHTWRIVPGGIS
jgi:hypothetical protein